jgi:hypothetical protein
MNRLFGRERPAGLGIAFKPRATKYFGGLFEKLHLSGFSSGHWYKSYTFKIYLKLFDQKNP